MKIESRKTLGDQGETLGWKYLQQAGYQILEKNVRTRFGELDGVAKKDGFLVFIEVRTRRHTLFGRPEETVDWRKRRKLIRLAQFYLQSKGLEEVPARFDILSITWEGAGGPVFSLIPDAFGLEEE